MAIKSRLTRIILAVFLVLVCVCGQASAWQSHNFAEVVASPHSTFMVTDDGILSAEERALRINEVLSSILKDPSLDPALIGVRTSVDGTPVVTLGNIVIMRVTHADEDAFGANRNDLAQRWATMLRSGLMQMKPVYQRDKNQKQLSGQKKHINSLSEHNVLLLVIEIGLLLTCSLLLGELMVRLKQPAIIGQMLAGILLGQTVLGSLLPDVSALIFPIDTTQARLLQAISWIGVIFLIMLTGMEADLDMMKKLGKSALMQTLIGFFVPMAIGFGLAYVLPPELLLQPQNRLAFAAFLGTAFATSSVPVVAAVLMDMNIMRRKIGQLVLAVSLSHDLISCLCFALIAVLASAGTGEGSSDQLWKAPLGAVGFVVLTYLCRKFFYALMREIKDHVRTQDGIISVIAIMLLFSAGITHLLGLHVVLGAFVVGVLLSRTPIINEKIIHPLKAVTMGLFAPIFFANAGLYIDLTDLLHPRVAMITVFLTLIAFSSKVLACYLAGKTSGLTIWEGLAVGFGSNARGSMGLILAMLGFSLGIIPLTTVAVVIFISLVSTALAPPLLKLAIARQPMTKGEQQEMKRQKRKSSTLLSHARRILVPTSGQFRAQLITPLVNDLSKAQSIEVVFLNVDDDTTQHPLVAQNSQQPVPVQSTEETAVELRPLRDTAASKAVSRRTDKHVLKSARRKFDETSVSVVYKLVKEDNPLESILENASGGYDLVVLGTDKLSDKDGYVFGPIIDNVATKCDVPVLIIFDQKHASQNPLKNILVPVNGTKYSMKTAELAISLAAATKASVTCVILEQPNEDNGELSKTVMLPALSDDNSTANSLSESISRDLNELAAATNVPFVVMSKQTPDSPAEIIIDKAVTTGADIIMLGGLPRTHSSLMLGQTIEDTLKKAPCMVAVLRI